MADSFGLEDEDVPIVEAVTGTCRLGNVFGIEILTEDEWIGGQNSRGYCSGNTESGGFDNTTVSITVEFQSTTD